MTSKLRHFALSGFHSLTFHGVEKFLLHFHKSLQSIDFSELSLVDDAILKVIGDNFKNLFVIKLNHCRQITDVGLINLFPVGKSSLVEVLISLLSLFYILLSGSQASHAASATYRLAASTASLAALEFQLRAVTLPFSCENIFFFVPKLRNLCVTSKKREALPVNFITNIKAKTASLVLHTHRQISKLG